MQSESYEDFDLADQIEAALIARPGFHAPSTIARWVKADSVTVRNTLAWMVRDQYAVCDRDSAHHGRARFALPEWRYQGDSK